MKLKVCSIFDSGVEAYMPPFYVMHKTDAIRKFTDWVKEPNSNMSKYPAAYTLFELGEFDQATGLFNFHTSHIPLGVATEFLNAY